MTQAGAVEARGGGRPPTFPAHGFDVVTGAFSYSGAAIAGELERVRAPGAHVDRAIPSAPAPAARLDVRPLDFDDVLGLTASLEGATTLYNTYWVRFPHGEADFDRAVTNSRTLFHAARQAGVERIVHVSITHPSIASPVRLLPGQGRGRARARRGGRALRGAPARHPLRRRRGAAQQHRLAPAPPPGLRRRRHAATYRIRAVHIDDLAALAVAAGAERADSVTDAVGPERPTFMELVRLIRGAVGSRSVIVRVPGALVPPLASALGLVLRDVLLTGDEYRAMADGLADTSGPATGSRRVERVDQRARGLARAELRQRDRSALPAPPGPVRASAREALAQLQVTRTSAAPRAR